MVLGLSLGSDVPFFLTGFDAAYGEGRGEILKEVESVNYPAVILKIMKLENYTIEEMDDLLNKKSGRIGFTGIGDFRLMKDAALEGNEDAILMRKMQTQRIKKYIGAYMAELNHVDAVVFTGGIMENNDDEISFY